MPESVKFFAFSEFTVRAKNSKSTRPIAGLFFTSCQLEVTTRLQLRDLENFNTFLTNGLEKKAKEVFISELMSNRGLKQSIGGTQWYISLKDNSLGVFVSEEAMNKCLESEDKYDGRHMDKQFMREVILELYDDANN